MLVILAVLCVVAAVAVGWVCRSRCPRGYAGRMAHVGLVCWNLPPLHVRLLREPPHCVGVSSPSTCWVPGLGAARPVESWEKLSPAPWACCDLRGQAGWLAGHHLSALRPLWLVCEARIHVPTV